MPDGTIDCQKLAATLRADRAVFGRLYDSAVRPKGDLPFIALAIMRDQKTPNLTGRPKDEADFAAALGELQRLNLLFDFLSSNADSLFPNADVANVTLQSITNFAQPFPPGQQLTQGHITAMRRTCRILCETPTGTEKGTGFLIGPHLVLTNWHVVKGQLDAAGIPVSGSNMKMKFEFDVMLRDDGSVEKIASYGPVEHWLVAASEAHQQELASGGQGQAGPWPNDPNELGQKLDFAVIELDGTPGYNHGYYDISDATWPVPNAGITLFQHPLGRAISYLFGNFIKPDIFGDNSKPPRIWHQVNTERGSSGGLCLDIASSKAVALHQAGYEFKKGVGADGKAADISVMNAAIPLVAIAAMAGQKVRDRIAAAPRIERFSPKNGAPIIGRGTFQKLVDLALRGDTRIMIVRTSFDPVMRQPRSKIGKSFSTEIMEALLPASQHLVFAVTAVRLTSDAYTAARYIVETVRSQALAQFPAALSGQTTLDADAIGTLVTPVIEAMKASAGNGILWLVIDDLDRHPVLSESTTSTFLNALYKAVAIESKLRIVLIGPVVDLPGLTGLPVASDRLEEHLGDSDIAEWITAVLAPRIPVLPQIARLMTEIARSMAEEIAKDPLKGPTGAVAQVLKSHWASKIRPPP